MKKIIVSLLCAVMSLGLNALYGGVIIGATDGEVKDSLFSEWLAIKDDAEFLRAYAILDAMADIDAYDTFADAQKQLTGKTLEEVAAAFDDQTSKDLQKNLSLLDEINEYNVVIDVSLLRAKIADAQNQPTLSEALSQATEDVSLIIDKPCAIHLLEEVLKLNDKDFIDFVCVSAAHNLTAQDNDTDVTTLDAKKLITELKSQYSQEYKELYSNFPSNNIVVQLGRFKTKEMLDTVMPPVFQGRHYVEAVKK